MDYIFGLILNNYSLLSDMYMFTFLRQLYIKLGYFLLDSYLSMLYF